MNNKKISEWFMHSESLKGSLKNLKSERYSINNAIKMHSSPERKKLKDGARLFSDLNRSIPEWYLEYIRFSDTNYFYL